MKIGIQSAIDECVMEAVSLPKILPLVLKKTAKRLDLILTEVELQRVFLALNNIEGDIINLDLEPPCGLGSTIEEIQYSLQRLIDGMADAIKEVQEDLTEAVSQAIPNCLVPCDHIPRRSWPLFRAKAMLDELIAELAPRSSSHRRIVPESSRA